MNTNFATRVIVRPMPRSSNSSSSSARMQVQAQINSYPVSINRLVFKKTAEEKLKLKVMKSQWKALNAS